jgi:glycosyltransferase involved in cell wall biosynthesis
MKVLHLCKFFPPVTGGIETVAHELCEGLARRGHAVQVLCASTDRLQHEDRGAAGYPVTRAASWGKLLSMSVSPALLRDARRRCEGMDIVHVHMPDPLNALAVWLARPRGKVVVHWHSDVVRQRLAMRLYRPLQCWLLRRADAVVATSQAYASSSPWLADVAAKTAVIPIGISDPRGAPDDAAVERIQDRFGGRRIVFSLGRMTYYKGFDVLIDAAAALQDHCVIIVGGEGDLLGRYRDEVKLRGLSDRIVFIGHVPEAEVADYLRACSVFCLASTQRAEAYGVVLLEAMAMGRPLVTTDIPGSAVPWINRSEETGLIVPVGDAAALAAAIHRIVADEPYARRLGEAARKRFERSFQADSMVELTEALYDRLHAGGDAAAGAEHS